MVARKRQFVDMAEVVIVPYPFSMSRSCFMPSFLATKGTAGQASSGTRSPRLEAAHTLPRRHPRPVCQASGSCRGRGDGSRASHREMLGRQGHLEPQRRAGDGMVEAELGGVQGLPRCAALVFDGRRKSGW